MRVLTATAFACGVFGVVVGCGSQAADTPVALPPSGTAYRALSGSERLAVAVSCRDRAAATAGRVAAGELGKVDPQALRAELDTAFTFIPDQHRPVAELCAEKLPFVTPGLRLSFVGATASGDAFTYETSSDKPLTIRGAVFPAPRRGHVVVRRESGTSKAYRSQIRPDGRFVVPTMRLRKMANNSFILAIHAPPSALRKAYFSAICLDCLAAGPAPSPKG